MARSERGHRAQHERLAHDRRAPGAARAPFRCAQPLYREVRVQRTEEAARRGDCATNILGDDEACDDEAANPQHTRAAHIEGEAARVPRRARRTRARCTHSAARSDDELALLGQSRPEARPLDGTPREVDEVVVHRTRYGSRVPEAQLCIEFARLLLVAGGEWNGGWGGVRAACV